MVIAVLALVTLLGLYMAWNIGANDVANSMAVSVGSKAISVRNAVIAAGICEFAGSVLVGSHVTDTVRKGIVEPAAIAAIPGVEAGEAATLLILGMGSALLAAAIWLNFATWLGMPVSTTHSIVGAVAGFGVVAAGFSAVKWGKLAQIVASWFISPVFGGVLAFLLFKIVSKLILGRARPVLSTIRIAPLTAALTLFVVTISIVYKGLQNVSDKLAWLTGNNAFPVAAIVAALAALVSRHLIARRLRGKEHLPLTEQLELVERVFMPLAIITSCSVAFSHGANDVANAIGPLAAIVDIVSTGAVKMKVHVPSWVLMLGGSGIVLGLATYGYRVMHTVGTKITQLTPSRGVAANIAAATTVLACTRLGLPVSTTHTLVGAILGIGIARGLAAVNRQVVRDIFGSWLTTVPAGAIMAILFFLVGRAVLFDTIRSILP